MKKRQGRIPPTYGTHNRSSLRDSPQKEGPLRIGYDQWWNGGNVETFTT
jgi:hypothetical protein